MKKNVLFNSLYEKIFYAGSFYDGTKVAHAEQFDLDLLFNLPKNIQTLFLNTNEEGVVQVKLRNIEEFERSGADNGKYRFVKT